MGPWLEYPWGQAFVWSIREHLQWCSRVETGIGHLLPHGTGTDTSESSVVLANFGSSANYIVTRIYTNAHVHETHNWSENYSHIKLCKFDEKIDINSRLMNEQDIMQTSLYDKLLHKG